MSSSKTKKEKYFYIFFNSFVVAAHQLQKVLYIILVPVAHVYYTAQRRSKMIWYIIRGRPRMHYIYGGGYRSYIIPISTTAQPIVYYTPWAHKIQYNIRSGRTPLDFLYRGIIYRDSSKKIGIIYRWYKKMGGFNPSLIPIHGTYASR